MLPATHKTKLRGSKSRQAGRSSMPQSPRRILQTSGYFDQMMNLPKTGSQSFHKQGIASQAITPRVSFIKKKMGAKRVTNESYLDSLLNKSIRDWLPRLTSSIDSTADARMSQKASSTNAVSLLQRPKVLFSTQEASQTQPSTSRNLVGLEKHTSSIQATMRQSLRPQGKVQCNTQVVVSRERSVDGDGSTTLQPLQPKSNIIVDFSKIQPPKKKKKLISPRVIEGQEKRNVSPLAISNSAALTEPPTKKLSLTGDVSRVLDTPPPESNRTSAQPDRANQIKKQIENLIKGGHAKSGDEPTFLEPKAVRKTALQVGFSIDEELSGEQAVSDKPIEVSSFKQNQTTVLDLSRIKPQQKTSSNIFEKKSYQMRQSFIARGKSPSHDFVSFQSLRNSAEKAKVTYRKREQELADQTRSQAGDESEVNTSEKPTPLRTPIRRHSSTKLKEKALKKMIANKLQSFFNSPIRRLSPDIAMQVTQSVHQEIPEVAHEKELNSGTEPSGGESGPREITTGSSEEKRGIDFMKGDVEYARKQVMHIDESSPVLPVTPPIPTPVPSRQKTNRPSKFRQVYMKGVGQKGRALRCKTINADGFWRQQELTDFDQRVAILHRKLKINKGSVDFERFEHDITSRKNILKELGMEAHFLHENLTANEKLRDRALNRLVDYSSRFCSLIMCNILLIQRWWRGVKHRMFFKTVVRRDLQQNKVLHQSNLIQMTQLVRRQEEAMHARIALLEEKGMRDKSNELMENKKREIYQLKKSDAIIKFETVMSKMLSDSVRKGTVKTLHEVKEPLFNQNYKSVMDQLVSYYQPTRRESSEVASARDSSNRSKSMKLAFIPTFADRINMDAAQNYNIEALGLQIQKNREEERKKLQIMREMKIVTKRGSGLLSHLTQHFNDLPDSRNGVLMGSPNDAASALEKRQTMYQLRPREFSKIMSPQPVAGTGTALTELKPGPMTQETFSSTLVQQSAPNQDTTTTNDVVNIKTSPQEALRQMSGNTTHQLGGLLSPSADLTQPGSLTPAPQLTQNNSSSAIKVKSPKAKVIGARYGQVYYSPKKAHGVGHQQIKAGGSKGSFRRLGTLNQRHKGTLEPINESSASQYPLDSQQTTEQSQIELIRGSGRSLLINGGTSTRRNHSTIHSAASSAAVSSSQKRSSKPQSSRISQYSQPSRQSQFGRQKTKIQTKNQKLAVHKKKVSKSSVTSAIRQGGEESKRKRNGLAVSYDGATGNKRSSGLLPFSQAVSSPTTPGKKPSGANLISKLELSKVQEDSKAENQNSVRRPKESTKALDPTTRKSQSSLKRRFENVKLRSKDKVGSSSKLIDSVVKGDLPAQIVKIQLGASEKALETSLENNLALELLYEDRNNDGGLFVTGVDDYFSMIQPQKHTATPRGYFEKPESKSSSKSAASSAINHSIAQYHKASATDLNVPLIQVHRPTYSHQGSYKWSNEDCNEPPRERRPSDNLLKVNRDLALNNRASTSRAHSSYRHKAKDVFDEEQSDLLGQESKYRADVSSIDRDLSIEDLRQKSFTFKKTSRDQTAFIKTVVKRMREKASNTSTRVTLPFSEAFPDLHTMQRLYAKTGLPMNPTHIRANDKLVREITRNQIQAIKARQRLEQGGGKGDQEIVDALERSLEKLKHHNNQLQLPLETFMKAVATGRRSTVHKSVNKSEIVSLSKPDSAPSQEPQAHTKGDTKSLFDNKTVRDQPKLGSASSFSVSDEPTGTKEVVSVSVTSTHEPGPTEKIPIKKTRIAGVATPSYNDQKRFFQEGKQPLMRKNCTKIMMQSSSERAKSETSYMTVSQQGLSPGGRGSYRQQVTEGQRKSLRVGRPKEKKVAKFDSSDDSQLRLYK